MDTYLKGTLVATGIFLIAFSLLNRTRNPTSALLYKVIPMLLGVACIISVLYVFGVLHV